MHVALQIVNTALTTMLYRDARFLRQERIAKERREHARQERRARWLGRLRTIVNSMLGGIATAVGVWLISLVTGWLWWASHLMQLEWGRLLQ